MRLIGHKIWRGNVFMSGKLHAKEPVRGLSAINFGEELLFDSVNYMPRSCFAAVCHNTMVEMCLIQDYEKGGRVILEVFHTILVLAITLVGNVLSIPTIFQNTYALGVHLHSID